MNYDSPTLWDIHGEICSEDLHGVERAIANSAWRTRIRQSAFDNHLELTIEAAGLFELQYVGGPDEGGYLLGGCVEPQEALAITLLSQVSNRLGEAGFRHRLECYEGDRLALYLHHDWPPPP